jgi:glucoamylase
MARVRYSKTELAVTQATHPAAIVGSPAGDPSDVAPYMLSLMQRNVATAGNLLVYHSDPNKAPVLSIPGCIIASPSYPYYDPYVAPVNEDYVFNWSRDAAITMSEMLSNSPALVPAAAATQTLTDYVNFAYTCQQSDTGNIGQANYTVRGEATGAADESDGPALRVLSILQGYATLDAATQNTARAVIATDLDYVLNNDRYQKPTKTLWEDTTGQSIFARAVQLRCLNEIIAVGPGLGVPVPSGAAPAAAWLRGELQAHWDAANSRYQSVLGAVRDPADPPVAYDPAIDPITACLYGADLPCTDPQLLSTAAQVRAQWTPGGAAPYPINQSDAGIRGPLLGRYSGDQYDGDTLTAPGGHPWAVCTCNFAELYYRLAKTISSGTPVPIGALVSQFFNQIGIPDVAAARATDVVIALRGAGDAMLNAVIYHSDHLELSEQFDATSGYEKSVSNLTWSYGAFLSAVRARNN